MGKLIRHIPVKGVFVWPAVLAPLVSSAQSIDKDTEFTAHALTVGFLVLCIIILVFLGLMLKARVNELQAFLKKEVHVKPRASRWQKLMSLDEEEVEALQERKAQAQFPHKIASPASAPGK